MNPATSVIIGASATRAQNDPDDSICCIPGAPVTAITGIFIFISAGMNLALGLGWDQYSVFGPLNHFRFSWFIGVIVGTILSIPLRMFIAKKFVMLVSAILILAEGIIFTAAPYNSDALLAGRYLNGIAVGMATITFLIHSSEIAANKLRGTSLAIEQYSLTLGVAIQMIYASQWGPWNVFPANRLHGILDIIFGALAAAAAQFLFIESPVDGLCNGEESVAWACLCRLELPKAVSPATRARLEELKVYVRYEESLTLMDDLKRGALPLAKMIFFRSMIMAFTFSLPLNEVLENSVGITYLTWPPVVAACLRIFGSVITQMQIDYVGRKLPSLICSIVTGGLMIGIGCICSNNLYLGDKYLTSIVTTLCLLVQFFSGCFAPFTSAFMGEAFPLRLKPYFIAVCVIVEALIHIIVICTYDVINSAIFLAQGVLILVASVALLLTMPETRKTSLKEAQGRFRHLLHLKMY